MLVYLYAFILLNVDVDGCAIGSEVRDGASLTCRALKKKQKGSSSKKQHG